jgi:hypothetical protein
MPAYITSQKRYNIIMPSILWQKGAFQYEFILTIVSTHGAARVHLMYSVVFLLALW